MIELVIVLFTVAALLGVLLALSIFQKKETPKIAVYGHGLFAVTGLVVLIVYMLSSPDDLLVVSLIIFAVAALAGIYMFIKDVIKKELAPKLVVVIHALAALAAFALVIYVAVS